MRKVQKKIIAYILKYIAVVFLFIWIVAPILWMFISSVSENDFLLNTNAGFWPSHMTFHRYRDIFLATADTGLQSTAKVFQQAVMNSLVISITTTLLCLIVGALAAYAFARLKFKFRDHLLFLFLIAQMLPAISLAIPFFLIFKQLGFHDKLMSLVLVYASFTLPYTIWILTNYFKTISGDIEDAARIDGCTRLGAFARVVIPMAGPGFVAVGVLSFLMSWDEFLYSLILMNSQQNKTIPVAISEFNGQFGIDYGMMMTGGFIATVIPLILAMVFQRWIAMGMTAGAVKE